MTDERFRELVELKANIDKTTVIIERLKGSDSLLIKLPTVDDLVPLDKSIVNVLIDHLSEKLEMWNDTFESIDI